MTDLIQWFNRIFIDPAIVLGGTRINLFNFIEFAIVFLAFILIANFSRRFFRRFLTRLGVEGNTQERLVWLISVLVVLIGLIVGLAAIGIDLTRLKQVLTYSIPIGNQTRLNLATILAFLAVLVGASLLSKYLRLMLRDRVLPPFHLPTNAQFLLLRLVHFTIILIGVLIGLNLTGLSLSSLLVVLGGLSIGIGFGLQNIASNLISGIIIIFERPIRVGDRVTVRDTFGTVNAINMRSTIITTPDNIDIIVPNSQFISESVTNWTHNDQIVRLRIPVGVAYGSDTALVKQALQEVADAHAQVIKEPRRHMPSAVKAPFVWFVNFGDSTLDFELVVWIPDLSKRLDVTSDLHFMIDQKFREHDITIAFPQRDVHLSYESNTPLPLSLQGAPESKQPTPSASAENLAVSPKKNGGKGES